MLSVIKQTINKVNLLNQYTSVFIYSMNIAQLNEQDLLCLSVKDIMEFELNDLKSIYDKLSNLEKSLIQAQEDIESVIGDHVDFYSHAEQERDTLKKQLQNPQEWQNKTSLQDRLDNIENWIYLEQHKDLVCALRFLVKIQVQKKESINIDEGKVKEEESIDSDEDIYDPHTVNTKIADVIKYRNLYINALRNTQKHEIALYTKIVEANTNDINYIEEVLLTDTPKYLFITINEINQLKEDEYSKDKLLWIQRLLYNNTIMLIQPFMDKLHTESPTVQQALTDNRLFITIMKEQRDKFKIDLSTMMESNPQKIQERTKLEKEIYHVDSYIYLYYAKRSLDISCELIDLLCKVPKNLENINKQISSLIRYRSYYISSMKKCHNTGNIILDNYQKQLGLNSEELYNGIVKQHEQDIQYIEEQLDSASITRDLSMRIKAMESLLPPKNDNTTSLEQDLKNNQEKLCLLQGLVDNKNKRYIEHKREKIFNILVSLNVITEVATTTVATKKVKITVQQLQDKLKKYKNKKLKEYYIFSYYIYLCAKNDYLNKLSIKLGEQTITSILTNEQSESRKYLHGYLDIYHKVRNNFREELPEYFQFINNNLTDEHILQCIPTKEEIEDILGTMASEKQKLAVEILTQAECAQTKAEQKCKEEEEERRRKEEERRRKEEEERRRKEEEERRRKEEELRRKEEEELRRKEEEERRRKEEEERRRKEEELRRKEEEELRRKEEEERRRKEEELRRKEEELRRKEEEERRRKEEEQKRIADKKAKKDADNIERLKEKREEDRIHKEAYAKAKAKAKLLKTQEEEQEKQKETIKKEKQKAIEQKRTKQARQALTISTVIAVFLIVAIGYYMIYKQIKPNKVKVKEQINVTSK